MLTDARWEEPGFIYMLTDADTHADGCRRMLTYDRWEEPEDYNSQDDCNYLGLEEELQEVEEEHAHTSAYVSIRQHTSGLEEEAREVEEHAHAGEEEHLQPHAPEPVAHTQHAHAGEEEHPQPHAPEPVAHTQAGGGGQMGVFRYRTYAAVCCRMLTYADVC